MSNGMGMPVTTTFTVDGYRIVEYRGVVRGIIVMSPNIAQGVMGGLKSIVGGKIGAYTEMCEQVHRQLPGRLQDPLPRLRRMVGRGETNIVFGSASERSARNRKREEV